MTGRPIEVPADEPIGEHAPTRWMLWSLSDLGYILTVEGASWQLLGFEPHELVGRHATELIPQDSVADGLAMWIRLHAEPGNTATNRRHWVRRDGSRIWMDDAYLTRRDPDGRESVLAVYWDATDRMAQEQVLREREAELVAREAEKSALAAEMQALAGDFKLLADEVPAAVFRCDASGAVLFHNARWEELVGDAEGVRLHDIVAPGEHGVLERVLNELVHADSSQRRVVEVAARRGERMWRVSLRGNGDGEGGSLVGSIEDVSATVKLRREACHDPLTGLLNRAALEACIADALAADPSDVLVLFIDLDGFKDISDTWGHDAGDAVLAEIGGRLVKAVRPGDAVGRYGGDEFVVVCGARLTTPLAITMRLGGALRAAIPFRGASWMPSASIGWACGRQGDGVGSLLRRADLDMFTHKRVHHRRAASPRSAGA